MKILDIPSDNPPSRYAADDKPYVMASHVMLLEAMRRVVSAFDDHVEAMVALKALGTKAGFLIADGRGTSMPVDRLMHQSKVIDEFIAPANISEDSV